MGGRASDCPPIRSCLPTTARTSRSTRMQIDTPTVGWSRPVCAGEKVVR